MALRLNPVRWALALLVVGLAAVAVVVALSWPESTAEGALTEATVTTPAPCSGPEAFDQVAYDLNGTRHEAKLDGCGHSENEIVRVLVKANTTADTLLQSASTVPDNAIPLAGRLSGTLVCLSGLAGALYAYLLTRRSPTPLPTTIPKTGP
ncbi:MULTISPECIES: hypothetical protein [Actinosynnema]|uniref:Uncharacterized protein n=1 Tax=Actinosynnema pretiosum TaxID=42197 RepID=A0A290Z0V0_9PSEU|nr:hypothetical protein [Actinosynnema pretiosum]ATE52579.1 hypothetical protein CNX65_04165 [Actinosynnema pretiosum]